MSRDVKSCASYIQTFVVMLGPYHCESCGIGSLRIDANARKTIDIFMHAITTS